MSNTKVLTVNRKGMITIPSEIRNQFNISEGSKVSIVVIDGSINIIPIFDMESLQITPKEKLEQLLDESHIRELELEE
jgi:AbrB family looped-hinge helix DNA binding protein